MEIDEDSDTDAYLAHVSETLNEVMDEISKFGGSDIGKELRRELLFRKRILKIFESENFQELLSTFSAQKEVTSVQSALVAKDSFEKMVARCKVQATELRNAVSYISIYGRTKAGKSTFSNALTGQTIFPVKRNPATSCAVIVRSGKTAQRPVATVYLSSTIKSDEDIHHLFQQSEVDDPVLEQRFKDLHDSPEVDIADIKYFVELPPRLRNRPLFEKVVMNLPIFGVEEEGVGLIDCPGTKENSLMSVLAIQASQSASIILFVFRTDTGLSNDDDDVKHIKRQMKFGKDVLFIFNMEDRDGPEDLKEKISTFHTVFGDDQELLVINLHTEIQSPKFQLIKQKIVRCLQKRAKSLVASFVDSMEKLIRTQHLFICRIISMHIDQSLSSRMKGRKKLEPEKFIKESVRLRAMVTEMETKATAKLKVEFKQFKQWFLDNLTYFKRDVELNDILNAKRMGVPFQPRKPAKLLDKLQLKDPEVSLYEKAVQARLQRSFDEFFGPRLGDYVMEMKLRFGEWLCKESQAVDDESQRVRERLVKKIWNIQTLQFFQSIEHLISTSRITVPNIVVPGVVSLAGSLGASFMGGIIVAGFVSASLATVSGGVVLALVAIGGMAAGFTNGWIEYFLDSGYDTEEEAQKLMLQKYAENLKSFVNNDDKFSDFSEVTLGEWTSVIEGVKQNLLLTLLEIESVTSLQELHVSSESLVLYLQLRDELSNLVITLRDEAQAFEWKFSAMKEIISEKSKMGRTSEHCFVCQNPIIRCGHLCSNCEIVLEDDCPSCTQPAFVSKILSQAGPGQQDLDALIAKHLSEVTIESSSPENEVDTVTGSSLTSSSYAVRAPPSLQSTTMKLKQDLKSYEPLISRFTRYWTEKLTSSSSPPSSSSSTSSSIAETLSHSIAHTLSASIAHSTLDSRPSASVSMEPINLLVARIIQNYTPRSGDRLLPYEMKRIIVQILHSMIFPRLWEQFLAVYRTEYAEDDIAFVEICQKHADLPFPDTLSRPNDPHWNLAALELKSLATASTPFEKLLVLQNMYLHVTRTQDHLMNTDDLNDALTYVLIKASYVHTVSDVHMMFHSLSDILRGDNLHPDGFLLVALHSLATQFRNVTDYLAIQLNHTPSVSPSSSSPTSPR